jgi:hypothetical protein
LFLLSLTALGVSGLSHAADNFSITPAIGYNLPSIIIPGSSVSAYYTITNLTHSTRQNYSIKGLPAAVSQDVSNPQYCPNTITLASQASCLLKLNISSAVNTSFALCVGSSCTKAAVPLSVSISSHRISHVTVGSYRTATTPTPYTLPLSYTTNDNGQSWAINANPLLPAYVNPASTFGSILKGVTCTPSNGVHCISVGSYGDYNGNQVPSIYTSNTSGQNWTPVGVLTLPSDVLASGTQTTSLAGVTCDTQGQACVAVGSYLIDATLIRLYPLSYTSTDGGSSWTVGNQNFSSTPFTFPDYLTPTSKSLVSVACDSSALNCVGVGVEQRLYRLQGNGGTFRSPQGKII